MIFDLHPDVMPICHNQWLAVTKQNTKIRIGVVGDTEQEARERFYASVRRWEELLSD